VTHAGRVVALAAEAAAAASAESSSGANYVPTSPFLRTMIDRGFYHQCTDLEALDARLSGGQPVAAYLGFDATASSLHVGSLLQIMILRHFQRCGHQPLVLVGGGTTKIGDPSGKDESRQMLDEAAIAANVAGISSVFDKFLTFGDGPSDAKMVNNDAWLSELNYLEFLREYGPAFTINRMMAQESVKVQSAKGHGARAHAKQGKQPSLGQRTVFFFAASVARLRAHADDDALANLF
jgi:tyrosyl-tRNA synthetase